MALKAYCFDGKRTLKLKDMPTDDEKAARIPTVLQELETEGQ